MKPINSNKNKLNNNKNKVNSKISWLQTHFPSGMQPKCKFECLKKKEKKKNEKRKAI